MTPRQTEILAAMQPGQWYKPSDLGTSQRFMNDLAAMKLLRRKTMKTPVKKGVMLMESAVYCLRLNNS